MSSDQNRSPHSDDESGGFGNKVFFALAAGAAAVVGAAAYAMAQQDEQQQKKKVATSSRSSSSSSSSGSKPRARPQQRGWFQFSVATPVPRKRRAAAPIDIDLLTSDSFDEQTPYQAIKPKGPVGYSVAEYGNLRPCVGSFEKLNNKLLYQVMRYCPMQDVAKCSGVCLAWQEFIAVLLTDRRYLKDCARQGLHPKYRGPCWRLLARSPVVTPKKKSMVQKLFEQKSVMSDDIGRDTSRTLIHYDSFSTEKEAVDTLNHILKAYAVHDPEVGYTQGMNFIAAFLLTQLDKEEAYWLFYTLMVSGRFRIRNLFTSGLPFLKLCQYQFQCLFEWFLPKLATAFEEQNVTCELYATEWFMTLYTYRSIPLSTSARIWDLFLVDGWKVLHRVGLAILFLSQDTLMSLDFEGLVRYLKFFPDQGIFNGDLLLKEAANFKVTNRLLHRLTLKYKGENPDFVL